MTERTTVHRLHVATTLKDFIDRDVLPGTGVGAARFWQGFDEIVRDLAPENAALLAERDRLQTEIDAWHREHPGPIAKMGKYRKFLQKIGYLVPVPAKVKVTTKNVDAEHAFYLGYELAKALTALQLGKEYRQDEELPRRALKTRHVLIERRSGKARQGRRGQKGE